MKRLFMIVGLFAMLVFVAAPVQALTLPFTSDHITNPATGQPPGGGTPPFGQVVLTQDGSNVDLVVSLFDGSKFIRTGAGGAATGLKQRSGRSWGEPASVAEQKGRTGGGDGW